MKKLIIFISLIVSFQFGCAFAQGQTGINEASFNAIKDKALNGDLASMNLVGNIYKSGPFGRAVNSPDYLEAKKWFEMAAEKGYAPAFFNLGTLFESGGYGIEKDISKARQYYEVALKSGFQRAQARLDELNKTSTEPKTVGGVKPRLDDRNIKNGGESNTTPSAPKLFSTGTGFFVNSERILTNDHVVRGCELIEVNDKPSRLIARDGRTDLAVLGVTTKSSNFIQISGSRVSVGDAVAVAGFPLQSILSGFNLTTGIVSSLTGIDGDSRVVQITAPVQPGNSGGPAIDSKGNLLGVIVSGLGAGFAAKQGVLPQNVNFAISANTAKAFLDANQITYKMATSDKDLNPRQIAEMAKAFTVPIKCFK